MYLFRLVLSIFPDEPLSWDVRGVRCVAIGHGSGGLRVQAGVRVPPWGKHHPHLGPEPTLKFILVFVHEHTDTEIQYLL